MASQIIGVSIVYSTVGSGAFEKKKRQSSASLAFVRGIQRWPVISPHKRPITRNGVHLSSCCLNCCTFLCFHPFTQVVDHQFISIHTVNQIPQSEFKICQSRNDIIHIYERIVIFGISEVFEQQWNRTFQPVCEISQGHSITAREYCAYEFSLHMYICIYMHLSLFLYL